MAQPWLQEEVLELTDMQGDGPVGFNKPYLTVVCLDLVKQTDYSATKKWLTDYILPNVTSAEEVNLFRQAFRVARARRGGWKPVNMVQTCLNIGFGFQAMVALAGKTNADALLFGTQGNAYSGGLPAYSQALGDPTTGPWSPPNWVVGKQNPDIMIQVASDDQAHVKDLVDAILLAGEKYINQQTLYREDGVYLQGREQFGNLDGIGQPSLRGRVLVSSGQPLPFTPRQLDQSDPRYNLESVPGKYLVYPGEMLLGYEMEGSTQTNPGGPSPTGKPLPAEFQWLKNGTFMVFRRLRQDVALFWQNMQNFADTLNMLKPPFKTFSGSPLTAEDMSAAVVGRWKSGSPFARTPAIDITAMGPDAKSNNAFIYDGATNSYLMAGGVPADTFPPCPTSPPGAICPADPNGNFCPIAGHIRKINPRGSHNGPVNLDNTLQHRFTRRGMPYGQPPANLKVEDHVDRGLLFVCYQSRIEDGFNFTIEKWANSSSSPGGGAGDPGYDMIIGQNSTAGQGRSRTFRISPNDPNPVTVNVTTKDEWVFPTGGGYFYVPSLTALQTVICAPSSAASNTAPAPQMAARAVVGLTAMLPRHLGQSPFPTDQHHAHVSKK